MVSTVDQQRRELAAWAAALAVHPEPVTFVDVDQFVRHLHQLADLGNPIVNQLLALYDAPPLTDGGRQVLGEFLRAYGKRLESERTLAKRTLTHKDSGKTVRAQRHQALTLQLDQRHAAKSRWVVRETRGVIRIGEQRAVRVNDPKVSFTVQTPQLGQGFIRLTEERSSGQQATGPNFPLRAFELFVIVEDC